MQSWKDFSRRICNGLNLEYIDGFRQQLDSKYTCPIHSHSSIEIVYHPRGSGVTHIGKGEVVNFEEGTVIVYAPHERHDQKMSSAGEDFCVLLGMRTPMQPAPSKGFTINKILDGTTVEEIRYLSQGSIAMDPMVRAIRDARATACLLSLIDLYEQPVPDEISKSEKYVSMAENYVRTNLASKITLRVVAESVGISSEHLRHLIHSRRGRSLGQYLTDVRMERAKRLLIHTDIPLKQVATRCGFCDEAYFSTVFRRQAFLSPGRYRTKMSQNVSTS